MDASTPPELAQMLPVVTSRAADEPGASPGAIPACDYQRANPISVTSTRWPAGGVCREQCRR